jgi:hypothetical protein
MKSLALKRKSQNKISSRSGLSSIQANLLSSDHKGLMPLKLAVGQPGDKYEQEADRVANKVVKGEQELTSHDSMNPNKHSLPERIRTFFETRFGFDFGKIRIHDDSNGAELARNLNAKAFTIGQEVFFGAGRFQPETREGQRLISHEMVHVLQQAHTPGLHNPSHSQGAVLQRQEDQTAQQQTQTFQIVNGPNFHQTLEGVTLNATLLANVTALSQHLIQNNLVTGNITFNQGVRSPAVAHRWSTAWSIRNNLVPLVDLQALPEGRDLDGNLWYQPGWTMNDAIQNATTIWNGAEAAGGYPLGDPRRAPNTHPGVSRHTTGNAMDVTIPWANGGGLDDPVANNLISQFGLSRPVAGEPWHFELR